MLTTYSVFPEKLLQPEHKELKNIRGIFHFTPNQVIQSDEYSSWVNSFPAETRNVIINENRFKSTKKNFRLVI